MAARGAGCGEGATGQAVSGRQSQQGPGPGRSSLGGEQPFVRGSRRQEEQLPDCSSPGLLTIY